MNEDRPKLPKDPLETLKGLSTKKKAHEQALQGTFVELESRLREALDGSSVWGRSDNCTLEQYGEDDAIYGYLSYHGEKLYVAHRTTEDDLHAAIVGDHEPPAYELKPIAKCSAVWLRGLASPEVLASLYASLQDNLTHSIEGSIIAARHINDATSAPLQDLDAALIAAAQALDYVTIIDQWRRAQAMIAIDPADAITRASSMMESLLKHILTDLKEDMPTKQDIQSLLKKVTRSLVLSPDRQATDDLRQVAVGVLSVVHGIGSLRTHTGSAHGRPPGAQAPTVDQARLAVNLSGSLSTYLMRVHKAQKAS